MWHTNNVMIYPECSPANLYSVIKHLRFFLVNVLPIFFTYSATYNHLISSVYTMIQLLLPVFGLPFSFSPNKQY